ncbi:LysR substrate-binding domain-containing protein [Streptomyces sp. NPDC091406]|uniref:LysR substrate-binding domain-containing protein n=1 Tax=unclassified Streptomyces TaxID=2593676 RepID=UPI0038165982
MNRNLQISPLRTLTAIVDHGGFGRAADALHLTQPAVSQQVRRLESLLKQPIFTATGRNMRLSPAGEELLGYARKMVALNDEAVARFAPAHGKLKISLGVSDLIADILPEVLRLLRRKADYAQITLRTGTSESLWDQMESGGLDVALLIEKPVAQGDYTARELGAIEMGWFGRPAISGNAEMPLVVYTEPCRLREHTLSAFQDAGAPWRIGYEGAELIGLRAAVQAGLGVGCLIANAGELWGLPAAVSPSLPLPPPAVQLSLTTSRHVPEEFTEFLTEILHQTLRSYPIGSAVR